MTTLAIIPDYENKRLEFSGTVAAGEHVAVSIVGGSEWAGTGSALRLRVLFGGKMVAVFPYWTDENEDDWPDEVVSADAWDTTGDDPTCTLVLNTVQAEKMLRRGGECLWILDDTENHTLYGMGLCHVEPWPKNLPSDVPYNLDGYPDFVKDAKQAILGAQAAISEAVDDANGIVAYVTAAKNSAQAAATNAGAFKDQAETAASNAGDFKTLAETAKTGAEAAQTAAETAQGKAEDAQAAAEAVLAAVENKADKVEDATEGNFAALDDEGNLADSGKNAEDFAASEHSHAMSEVTGLSEALDAKGSAETLTNVVNKVATLIGSAAGDDTRSVREIAALMIAALVAGADARYDTLKEIADWILNDTTGAAKMASDIATLAATKVDKVSGYGLSKNDFTDERRDKLAGIAAGANNYTLPAATASTLGGVKQGTGCEIAADGTLNVTGGGSSITIDPALSQTSENPVQNKVVSKALYTGFTEWEYEGKPSGWQIRADGFEEGGQSWYFFVTIPDVIEEMAIVPGTESDTSVSFAFNGVDITATRHLITPTKTSQLTNDGAPNGGGTPYATTAQIPDVTGKADKVSGAAAGNLAALDAQGNLADSGVKPSDFATPSDLPYALVTPGEWEFSDGGTHVISGPVDNGEGVYVFLLGYSIESLEEFSTEAAANSASSLTFDNFGTIITATRPSLPGHLCDRAGNRVVVSGDTTLTLPALVNAGKLRDFLVRLEISGSTVPTITFAAPTGETIVYETDGDEFPVPDEAGTWLYSFTETAAHTFAVSLKKVNTVTQGGS